jgi:hypothetical protein
MLAFSVAVGMCGTCSHCLSVTLVWWCDTCMMMWHVYDDVTLVWWCDTMHRLSVRALLLVWWWCDTCMMMWHYVWWWCDTCMMMMWHYAWWWCDTMYDDVTLCMMMMWHYVWWCDTISHLPAAICLCICMHMHKPLLPVHPHLRHPCLQCRYLYVCLGFRV